MNPENPMEPDEYQQAWQTQSSQTRVTIDADLLLKEVQRNQQDFQSTILGRDIREIGVGLVMIPGWFFLGAMMSLPWSWYLTVPALIWVVGFILVDRARHQRQTCGPAESLLRGVQESLIQLEHQIWLLRNIFWWYLLPFTVSILAFFVHVTWSMSGSWWGALVPSLVVAGIYVTIYYINQFAVRRQLVPRRQELRSLLVSLNDETNGTAAGADKSGKTIAMKGAANVRTPVALWRTLSVMVVLATITTFASVAAHFAGRAVAGYPKLSPFAAVSWHDSQPVVQIDGEWFTLVSLNDVPATEIVAFSRQTYGELWQKRFEEDLVEVLAGMGHEPNDTVRLVVTPLGSFTPQTLEDVPMTAANRRAIRAAAEGRASPRQPPPVVQLAPDVLEKYVGVYAISPQFALTVTLEGDQLMVQATGQQNFPVYPESEKKFVYKAVDAQLYFVANSNGAVNYLVLHQNGKNQVATRQE